MDTNDTSYKKENSDKDKNTKANKNDKRENKKQKSKRNRNIEKKQNFNPLNNQEEQKQHNETIKAEISKLIKKWKIIFYMHPLNAYILINSMNIFVHFQTACKNLS